MDKGNGLWNEYQQPYNNVLNGETILELISKLSTKEKSYLKLH